jgi:glucose/arabinose dehydrogenase
MNIRRSAVISGLLLLLAFSFSINEVTPRAAARSQEAPSAIEAIQLEPVVTSGLSSPLVVTNAHDGSNRLFIIEQGGIIKVLQPGSSTPTVFLDITTRVLPGGERGLLGLAFHPFFKNNRRFFVYYTRQTDGAITIAEYRASAANPNVADTAEIVHLTIDHPLGNHNGGTVEFGPDGYLYAGTGDGGSGNDPDANGQNINVLLGKLLRLDIDHPNGAIPYSSPPTNPFVGVAGRDEIYAYGLRNPYRFSFDRGTGQLYIADVGQGAWEEIDTGALGANYGWRVYEGNHCTNLDPMLCNPSGFTFPIAEYGHTVGRCSITGGNVYRGPRGTFPTGVYIYGDFCTGEIFMLQGGTQTLVLDLPTSNVLAGFGEDEAGEIYVVRLSGTVDRLVNSSASCSVSIFPTSMSLPASGGTGTIQVVAPTSCGWTASTAGGFISIDSGASGAGYGVVSFTVAQNASSTARTGTVSVSGQTFTVAQGGQYSDVPVSNPFYKEIGKLSARNITMGCDASNYCPRQFVTREEMAIFLVRALGFPNPPAPTFQRFADVDSSRMGYAFIEKLASLGITQGCGRNGQGQLLFCPDDPVTREQMAVFLIRAFGVTTPFAPTQQRFADVPPSSFGYAFVEELYRRGITQGCGANNFCPGDAVTREQMAAFLVRAFML